MGEGVASIPLPCSTEEGSSAALKRTVSSPAVTHYFVGHENHLVEVVVRAVLDDAGPGRIAKKYNPLLLYGPTGTGKSHLARGLAAAFAARAGSGSVLLMTAVDFARDWADAIETQSVDAFRQRSRRARLLVIEDMTLLADKPAAQRELIQVLDTALVAGHRVLATATSPPGQWPRILPGLQSRFGAGLSVPLVPPSLEARQAILRQWARDRGIAVSEAAIEILASGLTGSVRELIGALAALRAQSFAQGAPIDAAAARQCVAGYRERSKVGLREIAMATARSFDLTVTQLRSRTRRREVVTARGLAMYLARQLTEKNLDEIGEYFGGRDHTTVLHGCRKTETLLQTEPAVQQAIAKLQSTLHMQ